MINQTNPLSFWFRGPINNYSNGLTIRHHKWFTALINVIMIFVVAPIETSETRYSNYKMPKSINIRKCQTSQAKL